MAAAANKEFSKDVKTAADLEQQLLISYAQKGVCVLDIYSAEWGPCKAVAETFRRLHMEAGDAVHLRFYTVECNAVLESLKNPQDNMVAGRQHQRPKNTEAIKDSLPEGWEPTLAAQRGKSRPLFVMFKEGKMLNKTEGVDTPAIRAVIKDLCTVKTPASEFITNPRAQELWDDQFNPEESEVGFEKFCKGLQVFCGYSVSFNEEEKKAILEALGMATKEAKDRVVNADALQKWIGDDDTVTVQAATKTLLPTYEERAAAVAAEREADEKRRKEQEEQERKEREEREAEEKRQKEEQEKNERAARVQQLNTAIRQALALLPEGEEATEAHASTTNDHVDPAVAAAKGKSEAETAVPEVAPNAEEAAREIPSDIKGLWDTIKASIPDADFYATAAARVACSSSDAATAAASEETDREGDAAFAIKLLTAAPEVLQALVGAASLPEGFAGFRADWANAYTTVPGIVGAALLGGCERPEGELFVKAATGTVILSPLTPLYTEAAEGLVPVTALPDVLPIAKYSAHGADKFAALPWFARFSVGESAEFGEYLDRPAFEGAVGKSDAWCKGTDCLLAPARVRSAAAERDELEPPAAAAGAAPKEEEKDTEAAAKKDTEEGSSSAKGTPAAAKSPEPMDEDSAIVLIQSVQRQRAAKADADKRRAERKE